MRSPAIMFVGAMIGVTFFFWGLNVAWLDWPEAVALALPIAILGAWLVSRRKKQD